MIETPSPNPVAPDDLTPLQQAQTAQAAGRLDEAAGWYEQALALAPESHTCLVQLGVIRIQLGHHEGAAQALSQAVALRPEDAFAHYNLGNALFFRGDLLGAVASFQRAVSLDDTSAEAFYNLGFVQSRLGELAQAEKSLQAATERAPRVAGYWFWLGLVRRELGRTPSALACFDKALQLDPTHAEAHASRASLLQNLGRLEDSLQSFEAAYRHNPGLNFVAGAMLFTRLRLGRWEHLSTLSQRTVESAATGKPASHPFTLQVLTDEPQVQLTAARVWMDLHHAGHDRPNELRPQDLVRDAPRRIRVGYFSPDFFDHPVARLVVDVLARHDRSRFEVFAFSLGGSVDAVTEQVRQSCDHFIDASGMSDAAVVAIARQQALDIAIDLCGHTLRARTGIFVARVAPIQASYIGYLGTMGSPCYDYLIADNMLVRAGEEANYAEKLVRLPVYQANPAQREMARRIPSRAELKLPAEGVVFFAANNTYKILPETFARWWRILQQVPGSVLYLVAETIDAGEQLRDNACALGVDASRIIIGRRLRYAEYMARLQVGDLLLDTFPYTAGTTASDALWAGLPVLTLRGRSFTSRMAASVLSAAGLEELITDSPEAFEATAVALGQDPARLQAYKARLRQERRQSPLFNTARFTRGLELALDRMFDRARHALLPQHISVTAEEADATSSPDPSEVLQRGITLHQNGDLDAAEAAYLSLLRANPSHSDAVHLIGVAQFARGHTHLAQSWIERAIALAPAEPAYHDNIIKLHELQGQHGQALQCLDRALQIYPSNPQWWAQKSNALQSLGRMEEAQTSQSRSVELASNPQVNAS